ncbi:hypothetical protein [Pseudomonas sp. Snoq117.2]|uniref:hypothetical protein n=1 Tax=Pseudomonas sp. Snoq117.2 TaxID=1500302 RepID=UPI0008CCFC54|nr:hypothetical protein [Pseudomonas sp. Snoq117.2]SEO43293.1 hypothetical protein SAMN02787149_10156 [Pseudomonas sp. Snoq117.2]
MSNLITGIIVGMLLMVAINAWRGRDDTDSPSQRSNMRLHTDHKTGLQYLSAPGGGLTPRMGIDGKQMRIEVSE